MHRAYATLTIKAIDDATHTIEGIASTPSPDRMGDILESAGASFNIPLPLLWQHDSHSPIGRVLSAKVTKAGIAIRAQIDGGILPEIDRAWTLIKSGLVRGLSVGFRPLEMEPLNVKEPWGPQRFLKWEWLELSAVTIPANQDASISVIKSLCAPAQSGHRAPGIISPAAVGASATTRGTMPPVSDQLTAALADLSTKSKRFDDLMQREGAMGTLEDADATELKALEGELPTITSRVNRLKTQEAAQAAAARQTFAQPPNVDVRQVIARPAHVTVTDNMPKEMGLVRAVICRMAALRNGASAVELAKHHYPDHPQIAMFLKEAVPAGSSLDSTWAGPLVYATNLASEFVDFLRPQTIVGRIQGLTRVPFNVRIPTQTTGANGSWVGEGRGKPLTKFDFGALTIPFTKVANIAVITEELARFSNPAAETLVRNELVKANVERIDIDFVDPAKTASAGVSPASITNGITNLDSAGTGLADVDADVAAMMSAFANNNLMPTVWIMPNTVALNLSLMRTSLGARAFPDINMNGGTFMGLPVITSQYCILGTPANNLVILLAAPEILMADDGGFSIDVSREASLEMDDAPTMTAGSLGSPTGASGTVVVSMFQTNCVAVRTERFIYWKRRRDAGVVWMDDVQWSPSGS